MKRDLFNEQFAALCNAYTIAKKISSESQDVYWEMLKDIPGEKFTQGVRECLASCKFFPTIAELGEASMPAITDYRTPLPPIDKERPKMNWQVQLEREAVRVVQRRELPKRPLDRAPLPKGLTDGKKL